jgi:hypothetical protein
METRNKVNFGLCLLLVSQVFVVRSAHGQDFSVASPIYSRPASHRALWAGSVAAVAAANIMDIHSSWGKSETNKALAGPHGQFGTRGAIIKSSVSTGWLLSQSAVASKVGGRRTFAIGNFVVATLFVVSALHNYGIARPH